MRLFSELVVNRSSFEQLLGHHGRQSEEFGMSAERLRRLSRRLETEYEVLALSGAPLSVPEAPTPQAAPAPLPSLWATPQGSSATADFDELEMDRYTEFHLLSRALAENSNDMVALSGELAQSSADFEGYLTRASRLISEAQDKLMRLRMVPVANLSGRLYRAVRVAARQQAKTVELLLRGEETEIDKTVLETMSGPLLHLLRNSVAHGIETPELRRARGKDATGRIEIHAYHEGTEVVLEVNDDGAGLDPEHLRSAAVQKGYLDAAGASELTDDDCLDLIFLPGFSTASEVSELSGRGVGLDVVRTDVERLKGSLAVTSTPEVGITFTIRLPMTLAISQVLLVRAGEETFAIPLAEIRQISKVSPEAVGTVGGEEVLKLDDRIVPVRHLSRTLDLPEPAKKESLSVLLLSIAGKEMALVVDQILEAREVVVKTLGTLLRQVHGVGGATLMGDGSVVLILNPTELAGKDSRQGRSLPQARVPTGMTPRTLDVMIVDDSVSVRRVLTNLIRDTGWNPIEARDGLEALQVIQKLPTPPDVMLLDIEMPRMDGYELTSNLRAQPNLRGLPIIMVTSRAGEKHRKKAFEVGTSEYLVKPYRDETLIQTIRRLQGQTQELTIQ